MMVAGLERYFQIARCFRDEDLRADRQPEFTQIDIEASFIERDDIVTLVEGLLVSMFKAGTGRDIPTPFPRMTYQEAMDRYGSDKPDTRYGNEIVDMADVFANSGFKIFRSTIENGGVVRAINAKGFAGITTGQMIRLNEIATQAGMKVKQLAFIKVERDANGVLEYKSRCGSSSAKTSSRRSSPSSRSRKTTSSSSMPAPGRKPVTSSAACASRSRT
jgi:aspartyl-tRNA synthetase